MTYFRDNCGATGPAKPCVRCKGFPGCDAGSCCDLGDWEAAQREANRDRAVQARDFDLWSDNLEPEGRA